MKPPHRIIQVVPYFPPANSGVGDYALLLARQLRLAHDIQTQFVVGNPNWEGPPEADGFPVCHLKQRNAEEWERLLLPPPMPETMLLHYVGYGYEKRGCPIWLVRVLENWRNHPPAPSGAERRLVTMFHELYAFGAPWRSSFWSSPLQRWLTAQVARLSDRCSTNLRRSADKLEKMAPSHAGAVRVLPVFSNFGEPSELAPLDQRPPQAMMFGPLGRGLRNRSQGLEALGKVCRHLDVQKLIIVGRAISGLESLGVTVERREFLSPHEASRLLACSRVGLLDYFDGYLAKSGIFAAYCSHAMIPVLLTENSSEPDKLQAGRQFLVTTSLKDRISLSRQQAVADAAWEWYGPHNLARTAESFAEMLEEFFVAC